MSKRMSVLQRMFDGSEDFEPMSYSGRGMFDRKCLAFRVSELNNFLAEIFYSVEPEDLNEIGEMFRNMRTDNLGLDMVVYFPHTEFVEPEEEDLKEETEEKE